MTRALSAAQKEANRIRLKAWRQANAEHLREYKRAQRAAARPAAEPKPERGYHVAECSGKCRFWERCKEQRAGSLAAQAARDDLSGREIDFHLRPLPCLE
jgi:ferric-dicitrate binding protein FerR (iron transport regulator)